VTRSPEPPSGLVVVDKPSGWTSHQVVGLVRRLAGTRRVGHAGTLDPMATGVLVLGINRATRLLGHLSLTDKAYEGTIRLGVSTLTDDAEGEVVAAVGAADLADERVESGLAALRGEISQVPSAVSAIKIKGVRSYARVRSGEEVDLTARPVVVSVLEVVRCRPAVVEGVACVDLDVLVECTSGTYVRALARDLGAALGTGGHLTALRRTRVGSFDIAEAQTLEAAAADLRLLAVNAVARRCFAVESLDDEQAAWVRHGRQLVGVALPADPTALLDPDGEFLALYRPRGGDAVPDAVFTS
jgi:tRNA pseudouridine55 synthase